LFDVRSTYGMSHACGSRVAASSYRELVCWQLADELHRQALTIAKGSLAETKVQRRSGFDRGYFTQETVVELRKLAARCDRVTSALRAYLWKCP